MLIDYESAIKVYDLILNNFDKRNISVLKDKGFFIIY